MDCVMLQPGVWSLEMLFEILAIYQGSLKAFKAGLDKRLDPSMGSVRCL